MPGALRPEFERFSPISGSTRVSPTITGKVIILEICPASSQLKIPGTELPSPSLYVNVLTLLGEMFSKHL